MRLTTLTGTPVYYSKTNTWYSNITMGFGDFLLVPYNEALNYTTVGQLLGTNNSFGFQLTIQPVITVSVSESLLSNQRVPTVNVSGAGFPLSKANLSYCLFTADFQGNTPSYAISYGKTYTDEKGFALLQAIPSNPRSKRSICFDCVRPSQRTHRCRLLINAFHRTSNTLFHS